MSDVQLRPSASRAIVGFSRRCTCESIIHAFLNVTLVVPRSSDACSHRERERLAPLSGFLSGASANENKFGRLPARWKNLIRFRAYIVRSEET
jgi:hypothetical protein